MANENQNNVLINKGVKLQNVTKWLWKFYRDSVGLLNSSTDWSTVKVVYLPILCINSDGPTSIQPYLSCSKIRFRQTKVKQHSIKPHAAQIHHVEPQQATITEQKQVTKHNFITCKTPRNKNPKESKMQNKNLINL